MQDVENLEVRDESAGAVISVKVVPGASRDRLVGVLGGCLKVTTSAAPQKGRANAAVAKTLAGALGVDRRRVKLIAGRTRPRKEFRIANLSAANLRRRLRDA